jgi:hypothetical protein
MKNTTFYNYLGLCPICEREMFKDGKSTNQHHFVPKSQGGQEQEYCHRICHDKIHSIWTEKELAQEYCSAEKILEQEEMQKFVKWIKNKDPLFYASTFDTKKRLKKRKGR